MSNNEKWYYSHDGGERQGPFGWRKIIDYWNGGIITPDTLLYSSTSNEWTPAYKLFGYNSGSNSSNNTAILIVVSISIVALLGLAYLWWQLSIESSKEQKAKIDEIIEKERINRETRNEYLAKGLRLINRSGTMSAVVTGHSYALGKPHVSVTFAREYPDVVLVTAVWPGSSAWQATSNPNNPAKIIIPNQINAFNLDESITEWNCDVNERGFILLRGYEKESMP